MTHEFERKTWTAAGSWLGRQLASESADVEALAAAAAAVGISRATLNAAANEIGAVPMRNDVGVWALFQTRAYWAAYRDGCDAASGHVIISTPKAGSPTCAGGEKTAAKAPPSAGKQHETSAQIFARRSQERQAAIETKYGGPAQPRVDKAKVYDQYRGPAADDVYTRRSREAGHDD